MTDSLPEQTPQIVQPEQTGRRRFLGIGKRAVAPTVEAPLRPETLDDGIDLFGLEPELEEYEKLWDAHKKVIDDFRVPENTELVTSTIIELSGQPGTRDERRALGKLQETDFDRLASVFYAGGKLQVSFFLDLTYSHTSKEILGAVGSKSNVADDFKRATAKRNTLFNGMPATPSAEKLASRLHTLEGDSKKTYQPIYKQEEKMVRKLEKQLEADPAKAIQLVESFIAACGSEAAVENTFARYLANDMVNYDEYSVLTAALNKTRELAASGGLAGQFIAEKLKENDGDNVLAFFQDAFHNLGISTSFADYMAETRDQWPTEFREGYEAFATSLVDGYAVQVKGLVAKFVKKSWLHADIGTYEEVIDRLAKTMVGAQFVKKSAKPKRSKVSGSITVQPHELMNGDAHEAEPKKLDTGLLLREGSGYKVDETATVDDILDRLADKSMLRDKELVADLKRVIERLQLDPLSIRDVRSLTDSKGSLSITVNGKKTRLYRADPRRLGLSVSNRLQGSRVVFTVQKDSGSIAILGIPKSHDEYDRLWQSAIGS